jgi:hypothetical protein
MPNVFPKLSTLLALGLSCLIFTACTSSSSIPLAGPGGAPENPGEQGGDAKPTPTPTPGTSPAPSPTPGQGQNPTPTPVAEKLARMYCMPGAVNGVPNIHTLTGNAVEDYNMANLDFYLEDGTKAAAVKFPVALKSDGREGTLLLKAKFDTDASTPWKIYKAKIDFLKERGTLELVSSYSDEPNALPYDRQYLDLPLKMVDANGSRGAFVYPNIKGSYIIETLEGKKTDTGVSAERNGNPKFIRDSWIVFDQVTSGFKITQKFYSLKSGKASSLPSPSDSGDYQLFGYVNTQGTFFWLEGRPGGTWKLKSSGGSKSSTLATLPGDAKKIRLPAVFFEDQGQVRFAYLEENITTDNKGLFFAETGVLHVLAVSSSLKVTESKKAEYSDRIKLMIKNADRKLLRSLFFEPVSGNLYASVVGEAGLASYDLDKDRWSVHGTSDACLYPNSGIEETHE